MKHINVSLNGSATTYCEFYDKNNEKLNQTENLHNNYVSIDQINPITISAFVSIEDKKFYEHNGLNYLRIAKAAFNNLRQGSVVEGASTISQQLIKNKFLSNEKTLKRKIKEAYLVKKLEATETKDKIMESYLNTIYYGNGAYGIGNASKRFFNKTPNELSLSESCVLAGLVKSPNTYSPINNKEKSTQRRNLVLKEMFEDKVITQEEYSKAVSEEIILNEQDIINFENLDLYTKYALSEASEILNIEEQEIFQRGYKIYTYQDSDIQETLDSIISDEKYYQKNSHGNIPDSLSIVIDNNSSGVSAIAGQSEYNLVNFKRQPGSLLKPILVYTPALEEKIIYSCSEILDEKITIDNYSPQNVSDVYYGYVSIKDAVAKSLNIPAVKLCNELGVNKCKEYANRCGLEFDNEDTGLAIALGGLTKGFTLKDITDSYSPYINNGYYKKSAFVNKIISPADLTVYNRKLTGTKYCTTDNAYITTNIMQYSVKNGTSKKLSNFKFDIAGKTGTVNVKNSNLNTDAYSLAYTQDHIMSVWLGNYSMDQEYNLEGNNNGGTYATEIIRDTFADFYKLSPPDDFLIPESVKSLPIDKLALEEDHIVLLGNNIPERYKAYELFSMDNIPLVSSTRYSELPEVKLNSVINKNSVTLSFDTYGYLNYNIYRISNNGGPILLKTIKENNGNYVYTDYDIEYNQTTQYYIECSSEYINEKVKSNIENVTIEKDYSTLLSNNDNLTWLFS